MTKCFLPLIVVRLNESWLRIGRKDDGKNPGKDGTGSEGLGGVASKAERKGTNRTCGLTLKTWRTGRTGVPSPWDPPTAQQEQLKLKAASLGDELLGRTRMGGPPQPDTGLLSRSMGTDTPAPPARRNH